MTSKMTLLLIFFGLIFTTTTYSQETKYAYGIVNGSASVYGEYNIFIYYTSIDEVNCYLSRSDAERQLRESFRGITSRWDDASFTVNFFDSYSEAEQFKNRNVNDVRQKSAKRSTISITLADANVPFNFNCTN